MKKIDCFTSVLEVKRYFRDKSRVIVNDVVLNEFSLEIYINKKYFITLVCIEDNLVSLVRGFLYTESIVEEPIGIEIVGNRAYVTCKNLGESSIHVSNGGDDYIDFLGTKKKAEINKIEFQVEDIFNSLEYLLSYSNLFRETGNVHCAIICVGKKVVFSAEDISRHNAIDKVVGMALEAGYSLNITTLYTSGRIPSSIVKKIVNAGIPILVSRSAPSREAVILAKKERVTLIGFANSNRFNHYS